MDTSNRVQYNETNLIPLKFHINDRSELSSTYDMIIGDDPIFSWRIRHDHKLQWPDGHLWYWDHSNEEQRYSTLSSIDTLIEVLFERKWTKNTPRWILLSHKNYSADYKQVSASSGDVIKTCEKLHVEEQDQLKILLQKYEHLFDWTLREIIMYPAPTSLHFMSIDCKPVLTRVYTVPR
jgi:hypothetical protein